MSASPSTDLSLHQRELAVGANADQRSGLAVSSVCAGPAADAAAARGPGTNARTQRARILREMRRRRDANAAGWVSGLDFRAPTCDGGPEIHNITPRVSELRAFHQIVTERGPDGIARYRLAWDLGDQGAPLKQLVDDAREAARSADSGDEPARLFEPATPLAAPPLNAALTDDWGDAA